MSRWNYCLLAALLISLFLHLLAFLPDFIFRPNSRSTVAPLQAELRKLPLPSLAPPPLSLPEPKKPPNRPPPPQPAEITRPSIRPAKKPTATTVWTQSVREQLQKLDTAGQFYPPAAIAQGLQGEVQVLMIIDENGRVSAARVEQGSGHAILDEAALRAVRSLKSLPQDAPRETILPVRFRLK